MKKTLLLILLGFAMSLSVVSADTSVSSTKAPEAHGPTPSAGQMKYYKEELAAFMHFGMNTFTGTEWGNGKENPQSFNPTALDAEQWVKVFDDMGFKRLIMVAKHHDGFNIWPSEYTEHSVKNSPWKDGKGDLLEEVSAAATKYDMNMGFYLSPWDAHEPSYGDGNPGDYNEFYINQLHEVLGDSKYGNDGVFDEVWMDGAKGSGAEDQHYRFDDWFDVIKSYNEDTVIFSPYGTEVRWIGNENGLAGEPSWQRVDSQLLRDRYDQGLGEDKNYLNHGKADGKDWSVGEADVSIRSGWFYHENQQPKSVRQLTDIYFKSVGRGVPLLLNVPADKRGLIHESDITRLEEFKAALDGTFTTDFTDGAEATASSIRGNSEIYNADRVLDGDYDTYWTMDDGQKTGSVTINLDESKIIDIVEIQEYIPLGQRIAGFTVDVESDGQWYEFGKGQTIGYKRLVRGNPVRADKIRVTIDDSQAVPLLNNISAYKSDKAIEKEGLAPLGLKSIDNTEFKKSNGWNNETGIGMNNTSMWSVQKDATASFEFTGSKAYITATQDPNHGVMEVKIDGKVVGDVDTYSTSRSAGRIVYETPDLEHGTHTVEIRVKGERSASSKGNAIGVDGAYYLSNNGSGMFELSPIEKAVDEGESITFTIDRIGGSVGEANITFQTAPGTAVHGRNYTDKTEVVKFGDGETSKTVTVNTIDNNEIMGDVFFTAELVAPTNGAISGFNVSSKVTIIENDEIIVKDEFNKENPLVISKTLETTVEAEKLELIGKAMIQDNAQASEKKVVGWIGHKAGDSGYTGSLDLWFDAPVAGTYEVDMHYYLGSPNTIKWSNQKSGDQEISGSAELTFDGPGEGAFGTETFTIKVEEAGIDHLRFFNDEGDGPNLDKFVIRLVEEDVSQVLVQAQLAVEQAELNKNQTDLNAAKALVDALNETDEKNALFVRLDLVQSHINLKSVLDDANTKEEALYTSSTWANFITAREAAQATLDNDNANKVELDEVKSNLAKAMNALKTKDKFTEADPLDFSKTEEVKVEAEKLELVGDAKIQDNGQASGGKLVGWIGHKEGGYSGSLDLWFDAPSEGTYEIDINYYLGALNIIKWSNQKTGDTEISGITDLPFDGGDTGKFGNKTITIEVKEAGVDHLRFFNDEGDGPNLDSFAIRYMEEVLPTPLELAEEEVLLAEVSKLQADVDAAQILVDALEDTSEKAELNDRLAVVQAKIDQVILEENAHTAVELAEDNKSQDNLDAAQLLVDALEDSKLKTELHERLEVVQSKIDQVALESKAITAVELAEESKLQADIDAARDLVNTAFEDDSAALTSYIARLDVIETINADKVLSDAIKAAEEAIDALPNPSDIRFDDKEAIEAARELVEKVKELNADQVLRNEDLLATIEKALAELIPLTPLEPSIPAEAEDNSQTNDNADVDKDEVDKEDKADKAESDKLPSTGMGNNFVMMNVLLAGAGVALKTLNKRKED